MPFIFNQDSKATEMLGTGVGVQRLIDTAVAIKDQVRLERWQIAAGGRAEIAVGHGDICWVQVLSGRIALSGSCGAHDLHEVHLAFLPGGFAGTISSAAGAVILRAVVPDAARFDPAFGLSPPGFRIVDWSEEPVLDSEHDARKRIYFVTPKLFATKALSGEMIIYPPGTAAADHYHEGAEHFQYVLRGRGTVISDGRPHALRAGDIVWNHERECHYFIADPTEEFVFVEFFVPGTFKTIWVDDAPVCTWLPTGKNIKGGRASRDIAKHSTADSSSEPG